jgi:hypothetical protein
MRWKHLSSFWVASRVQRRSTKSLGYRECVVIYTDEMIGLEPKTGTLQLSAQELLYEHSTDE